jgi:hypothetical protein
MVSACRLCGRSEGRKEREEAGEGRNKKKARTEVKVKVRVEVKCVERVEAKRTGQAAASLA